MNKWSKESLEEMFGDNVIEQLTFLSGCTKHSYCDPSHNGYIVSYEKLEKFAELIIQECINVVIDCDESPKMILHEPYRTIVNRIAEHFGVEE